MSELLEVTGLTAGYAEAVIISDVNFVIKEGQTLALLGRNGVGKTTLINTLIGVTQRHSGQIKLSGQSIEQWTPYERVRNVPQGGIGWVPHVPPIGGPGQPGAPRSPASGSPTRLGSLGDWG